MSEQHERFAGVIHRLEELWDFPDGYFFRLREGDYDPAGADAVIDALKSIPVEDDVLLPRRLVSLTWWMPTFMEWQKERVAEEGGDAKALEQDATRVRNVLDEILGVP
jgi:hypothetical protein